MSEVEGQNEETSIIILSLMCHHHLHPAVYK